MKIRIQADTIRLRLTQTDIDDLGRKGEVEETTHFGDDLFSYSISLKPQIEEPVASFTSGQIAVELPLELGRSWIDSELVGIENKAYISQSEGLKILVEKDFQCLHQRSNEDESDAFPNPLAG